MFARTKTVNKVLRVISEDVLRLTHMVERLENEVEEIKSRLDPDYDFRMGIPVNTIADWDLMSLEEKLAHVSAGVKDFRAYMKWLGHEFYVTPAEEGIRAIGDKR